MRGIVVAATKGPFGNIVLVMMFVFFGNTCG